MQDQSSQSETGLRGRASQAVVVLAALTVQWAVAGPASAAQALRAEIAAERVHAEWTASVLSSLIQCVDLSPAPVERPIVLLHGESVSHFELCGLSANFGPWLLNLPPPMA